MGIIKLLQEKLLSLQTGGSQVSANPKVAQYNHKRYHVRYNVNNRNLFQMLHHKQGAFNVVDLSHHGALVESVDHSSLDHCSAPIEVELNICGQLLKMELAQCQKRKSGWGVVFKHMNESSILAIGGLVEPLRWGSTAVAIDSDRSKDGVMSRFRKRFQGDGPFDLVYEIEASGQANFIMVTLRRGAEYGSVIWDNGQVITKKSIDNRGDGARMSQTVEADRDLVWVAAVACLGLRFNEGASAAQVLTEWLAAQNQSRKIS